MTPKEKETIALKIKEEIDATLIAIKKYKELTKPIAPENAIGRVSRMDAINNKSVNESALKKAQLKHKNLQIALDNINDDDFGVCAKCNTNIPIGRILLVPQSRFCIRCAQ